MANGALAGVPARRFDEDAFCLAGWLGTVDLPGGAAGKRIGGLREERILESFDLPPFRGERSIALRCVEGWIPVDIIRIRPDAGIGKRGALGAHRPRLNFHTAKCLKSSRSTTVG